MREQAFGPNEAAMHAVGLLSRSGFGLLRLLGHVMKHCACAFLVGLRAMFLCWAAVEVGFRAKYAV
jgi:hypothetical protein